MNTARDSFRIDILVEVPQLVSATEQENNPLITQCHTEVILNMITHCHTEVLLNMNVGSEGD